MSSAVLAPPLPERREPQGMPRQHRARGRLWWRLLALVAIALSVLAARSCEVYTMQYQTFPLVDWLESHPLVSEAEGVPPAALLAMGVAPYLPELGLGSGPIPFAPKFQPPGIYVRELSGVRDAAVVTKSVPAAVSGQDRVHVSLSTIVFHRTERARAWVDLRSIQQDLARAANNDQPRFRISALAEPDGVWIQPLEGPRPAAATSGAVVVGHRGPIGFEVQVTSERPSVRDRTHEIELSARAETLARQVAAAWTAWLAEEGYPASTAEYAASLQPSRLVGAAARPL